MQRPRIRLTVLSLMVIVAIAALACLAGRLALPAARYRYIVVFYRQHDGSPGMEIHMRLDLEASGNRAFGKPSGAERFRETIAELNSRNADYKVTSPRAVLCNGTPVYRPPTSA